MLYKLALVLSLSLITVDSVVSQDTPEKLGSEFFTAFKSNNLKALDTLTANCAEVKELYLAIDSSFSVLHAADFCEKFEFHDSRFKKKIQRFRNDTALYNIDWESASLTNIEYSRQELQNATDITAKTNNFTIHYLNIHFSSEDKEFSIGFKGIKKIGDVWKLGSQVRMREMKND